MKKLLFTLVFASVITTLCAQTETEKNTKSNFNQWSIELAGGFNTVDTRLTPGYFTATPGLFVVDLGARYMINNKFGLKADFGYNSFEPASDSKDFNTQYYRFDVQGVANLGRIMNFETWTNTIGLLGHTGLGVGFLDGDNFAAKDNVANFIAGITAQVKLSNKFVLTGDLTTIYNSKQTRNFDGAVNTVESRGFTSHVFNATLGLTYYLGKNETHADWFVDNKNALEIEALKEKVTAIETGMLDTDRDGVSDYIDEEQNTISGVTVNTKGKAVDLDKNGVPDELDRYMNATYLKKSEYSTEESSNEAIKKLINNGYVSAYFDSNSSTPTAFSAHGLEFILTYLKNNPTASIDIIGHTDEVGGTEANNTLSLARAESVKKILVNSKVEASRLNVVAAGKTNSVNTNSEAARKLFRTVTFMLK
jgi:outer membrane protein OmpA-like peptidoglycan-associated protein